MPPAMNRMIRWPASMLAKSRTLSETIRIRFDSSSSTKMNAAMAPVTPEGISDFR